MFLVSFFCQKLFFTLYTWLSWTYASFLSICCLFRHLSHTWTLYLHSCSICLLLVCPGTLYPSWQILIYGFQIIKNWLLRWSLFKAGHWRNQCTTVWEERRDDSLRMIISAYNRVRKVVGDRDILSLAFAITAVLHRSDFTFPLPLELWRKTGFFFHSDVRHGIRLHLQEIYFYDQVIRSQS